MRQCGEVRAGVSRRQRQVLHVVLWINLAMFLAEAAGAWAHATALPDVAVGLLIAGMFSISAVAVFRAAASRAEGLAPASRDRGSSGSRGLTRTGCS